MATIQGKTTARVMAKQGLTVEASEALARSRADALQKRSEATRKSTERLSQINTALQDAISKGDINQIDILNADFKSAQEDAKKNATDLAQAMVGLGEGFKDIGLALEEIQDLAPNEQQVIDDAKEFAASKKAKLEAARIKRAQAEGKTNILGIRANAIAVADAGIETAKAESETAETAIKTAEQGAESMRRSRLESMSFEQSLQRMQTVTQRIIEMAKDRIGEIEGNLEAVEVGRHEIVEDLKRYSVEVDEGDKALKQGKAELQGLLAQQTELLDKNSAEWTDLLGQIKEKQNELGTIEGARNIAYSRSQNGQRFLEGLGMQEETQRTLLSFHKIWIANLEDSVRHRSTMTDSHLGVIRAVGDQQAMDMVDRIGVETDERITEDAAKHLSAARKGMINRMQDMPDRILRMRDIRSASAQAKAAFDDSYEQLLVDYRRNYGTSENYDDTQQFRENVPSGA